MRRADTLEESADTRTVLVRAGDADVKLSFFGEIECGEHRSTAWSDRPSW